MTHPSLTTWNCRTIMAATVSTAILCTSGLAHAADNLPSREEMWAIIQKQQKQIDTLLAQQKQTDRKVEATADRVEQVQTSAVSNGAAAPGWWQRTSLGGYGELHYNGLRDNADDSVDFHRFVLFINHDFNDRLRMFSEIELEHALSGDGEPGEVELEQAFIEYDINDQHQARAGLFLLPVGILNETHEPPTFFGVERNPVESNIIPSTWWEAGVGVNGELGNGFSYDFAVHSGLDTPTTGGNAYRIRNGRQKVASADADKGAVTGRVQWSGMPGIKVGVSTQYQQDVTQGNGTESVSATLLETHADIRKGPWGLRALYARWDLDGTAPSLIGRDEQTGWYIEPSYTFDTAIGDVGIFARYNQYDNNAGISTDTEITQTDVGINYWPHPDVVLKADMAFIDNPAGTPDDEVLNLGVGFQF